MASEERKLWQRIVLILLAPVVLPVSFLAVLVVLIVVSVLSAPSWIYYWMRYQWTGEPIPPKFAPQLNEYSRRFAGVLFAAHPEWRKFATVDTTEGVDEGSLVVEVSPSEPRDIKWPLHISTDGEEITIGFDLYHTHFNRYADDQEAEAFAEALAFIADLLAERVAVISWWDGDEYGGSSSFATDADAGTPSWASNANAVRVRSWRGTYDRDIAA